MRVKYKSSKDGLTRMADALEDLNGRRVIVGALKGEHAWLVGIHEYGCRITPRKGKYLTVPLVPEAKGRKASSFPDTFVYTAKTGNKFIARKKGNGIELLYWLTTSIVIPERSFIRAGHDKYVDEVMRVSEHELDAVMDGTLSANTFLKIIGTQMASKIKDYARDLDSPPNSPITTNVKRSTNPLADSGDMIESIWYEVEK